MVSKSSLYSALDHFPPSVLRCYSERTYEVGLYVTGTFIWKRSESKNWRKQRQLQRQLKNTILLASTNNIEKEYWLMCICDDSIGISPAMRAFYKILMVLMIEEIVSERRAIQRDYDIHLKALLDEAANGLRELRF